MSSIITLEFATEKVASYLAAEECVLTGQQYSIGDRALTRVDLRFITKERKKWEMVCSRLAKGVNAPIVTQVIPRDG